MYQLFNDSSKRGLIAQTATVWAPSFEFINIVLYAYNGNKKASYRKLH